MRSFSSVCWPQILVNKKFRNFAKEWPPVLTIVAINSRSSLAEYNQSGLVFFTQEVGKSHSPAMDKLRERTSG